MHSVRRSRRACARLSSSTVGTSRRNMSRSLAMRWAKLREASKSSSSVAGGLSVPGVTSGASMSEPGAFSGHTSAFLGLWGRRESAMASLTSAGENTGSSPSSRPLSQSLGSSSPPSAASPTLMPLMSTAALSHISAASPAAIQPKMRSKSPAHGLRFMLAARTLLNRNSMWSEGKSTHRQHKRNSESLRV